MTEHELKLDNQKTIDLDSLIEKGKQGKLSSNDLEEVVEEMDFDIEEQEIDDEGQEVTVINTYFIADLSRKEISILAMCIVYEWFKRDVNDATQYRQKLSTRDFKTESSYQSLQKRSEYLDKMKEQICQEIQNYQVDHMDELYSMYGGL